MKSKFLKSIVVITLSAAILSGLFYAKNHRDSTTRQGSDSASNGATSAPTAASGSEKSVVDAKPVVGGSAAMVSPSNGATVALATPPAASANGSGASEMDKTAQLQKGPECFQVTFTSKDIDSRIKDNAFAFQRNLLKLPEAPFNAASRCVRVDGKPVRFESPKDKPSELTIAPLKNIHSVVTASYCLGESKCNESCKAPADQVVAEAKVKDEFLEAIGGDDEAELSKDYGKWDNGAKADEHNAKLEAALDPEIKRELANLDEEESKPKKAPRKIEIFSGWSRSDESPSCRPNTSGSGQKAMQNNSKKENSS